MGGQHISPRVTEHFNCGALHQSRDRCARSWRCGAQPPGPVPGPPSIGTICQSCLGRPAIASVPGSENNTLVEAIARHAATIATPDRHLNGTRLGLSAGARNAGIANQRCGARLLREGMVLLAGGTVAASSRSRIHCRNAVISCVSGCGNFDG